MAIGLGALLLLSLLGAARAQAETCPNEALRVGASALLPGCRAYEMVSPIEKNGSNVNQKLSVRAAPDGAAAGFVSTGSFADNASSPLGNNYVGRRGTDNWSTQPLDPPQSNPRGFLLFGAPASSDDFEKTIQYSKEALAPGAIQDGSNVYIHNNLSGVYELVAAREGNELFQSATGFGFGLYLGGSTDWSHVLLRSSYSFDPGQAADGTEHLWDFTGGEPKVVDILPNGELSPEGAHYGPATKPYAHVISEDGSRIFFTANSFGSGGIYMREGDARTVPISASQREENEGEVASGEFQYANADGSVVYFTSYVPLTEDSETNGSQTLYRYDVETETLTDLTPDVEPNGAQINQVMAISEDGSYVYFASQAPLAPGATPAGGFSTNLYLWHGGEITFLGQTEETEMEFSGPLERLASPDGRYFGFSSLSRLTPEDEPSEACPEDPEVNSTGEHHHCREVYLYDSATNQLTCTSCDGPGRGESHLGGQEFHENGIGDRYPRALLDDGTEFIDTPNRLLPRDANGVGDVYAWREGELTLFSTGMGEGESTFGDATLDGSNVFLLTNQQLVKQDIDQNVDLYDARVGGGLAGQFPPGAPPPCEGEGCRAPEAPAASAPSATSATTNGAGNLPRRCARLERKAARARAHHHRRQARRLKAKARKCGGQG
jgi:hypothetical protein